MSEEPQLTKEKLELIRQDLEVVKGYVSKIEEQIADVCNQWFAATENTDQPVIEDPEDPEDTETDLDIESDPEPAEEYKQDIDRAIEESVGTADDEQEPEETQIVADMSKYD